MIAVQFFPPNLGNSSSNDLVPVEFSCRCSSLINLMPSLFSSSTAATSEAACSLCGNQGKIRWVEQSSKTRRWKDRHKKSCKKKCLSVAA